MPRLRRNGPPVRLNPAPTRRYLICPRCRAFGVVGESRRGWRCARYLCLRCGWRRYEDRLSNDELRVLEASSLT